MCKILSAVKTQCQLCVCAVISEFVFSLRIKNNNESAWNIWRETKVKQQAANSGQEGRQVVFSRLNSEREKERGGRDRLMNWDFVPVTHKVANRVHTVQHHLRLGPSPALPLLQLRSSIWLKNTSCSFVCRVTSCSAAVIEPTGGEESTKRTTVTQRGEEEQKIKINGKKINK